MQRIWCICFIFLICLVSSPALADSSFESVFALKISEAYTTQMIGGSSHYGGYGVGARGGFRIGQWGGFMELQYVGWTGFGSSEREHQASLNFGLGAEVLYFDRRVRTALSVGAAILATKAVPDPVGTFGLYVDLIPASYVLKPTSYLNIVLTPLSLFVNMPSLGGIPLVTIQYRTVIAVEFSL